MSSWWTEKFAERLAEEQARMKRELTPRQVERVLEKQRRLEEKELRGFSTLRNAVAPVEGYVALGEPQEDEEGDDSDGS
jgi:hypothetical protein